MQIAKGRPQNIDSCSQNELEIYHLLEELNISFTSAVHKAVYTMDDCRAIEEVLAPAYHCKNLFLCPTNKSQYYILVMEEHKKFSSGKISRQVNSSRLQFGDDDALYRYLGVKSGAVGVLSLAFDKEHKVQLLVDADIIKTEHILSHPGVNTVSVSLKTKDLFEKYLQATGHDYIVVEC